MSWRGHLQKASFRGVKFHVDSADSSFGRNRIVHEFSFKEEPYIEDMGRSPRHFPLEGYLVGDDYNLIRDLLIKAAEKEGPGKLVHPYLGIKQVECLSLCVRECFDSGGYARISFDFIEAPPPRTGGTILDQVAELLQKADDLMTEAMLSFTESFSVVDMPSYVVDSAAGLVQKLADFMLSSSGLGVFSAATTSLSSSINDLKSSASELVHNPKLLAQRSADALKGLGASVQNLLRVSKELSLAVNPPPVNTTGRAREFQNGRAFSFYMGVAAISLGARSFADQIKLSSSILPQNISYLKAEITNQIDEKMLECTDDRLFSALHDLRTAFTRVLATERNLPTTREVVTSSPTSSLVLCYEIFGDLTREKELLDLNDVPNSLHIPSGKSLKVVSRE